MSLKLINMTKDDMIELDIGKLIVENSKKMNEFLEKDYEKIKNKSISVELKKFWSVFEKKLNIAQKDASDNQILNVFIVLSDVRSVLINKMDVIEPWFVKIEGVNCKTGLPEKEVLNSRKQEPEIKVEPGFFL